MAGRQIQGQGGRRHRLLTPHDLAGIVAKQGQSSGGGTNDYNDLINKPTIPAAQVNSDWDAVSGVAVILNKPTLFSGDYNDLSNTPVLATVATSGDYNDLINTPADSGWIAPTLLNGWSNFGSSYNVVAYRKIGKQVFIRGLIQGGTNTDGTVLFFLPSGFRPSGRERFRPSASIASSERIVVGPDIDSGSVAVFGLASGSNLGLSGINFFID